MNEASITLKGTGDGVKIFMSDTDDFSKITKALYDKLDEFRRFFGSGECNVYFIGRDISSGDKLRLETITKTMLPNCCIHYGEPHVPKKKEAAEDENEKNEKIHQMQLEAAKEFVEERIRRKKEAITTNFKRNRARYFEGDVHEGKSVESDGHLILLGNVEKNASVKAAGNVIIIGHLRGTAYAGSMGSRSAYIIALGFEPQNIRIADIGISEENIAENGANIAFIEEEKIFVEKFDINS